MVGVPQVLADSLDALPGERAAKGMGWVRLYRRSADLRLRGWGCHPDPEVPAEALHPRERRSLSGLTPKAALRVR
ncbi:hypothetical protein GCM10010270_53430 [Streptomyces violaceus]|nr:hypothetical protein GCM10010270_53430 [Streptomyces janthinus]